MNHGYRGCTVITSIINMTMTALNHHTVVIIIIMVIIHLTVSWFATTGVETIFYINIQCAARKCEIGSRNRQEFDQSCMMLYGLRKSFPSHSNNLISLSNCSLRMIRVPEVSGVYTVLCERQDIRLKWSTPYPAGTSVLDDLMFPCRTQNLANFTITNGRSRQRLLCAILIVVQEASFAVNCWFHFLIDYPVNQFLTTLSHRSSIRSSSYFHVCAYEYPPSLHLRIRSTFKSMMIA